MALTVNPRCIQIREPNLLIPGRKPVGPVRVDWSHPLAKGLQRFMLPVGGVVIDVAINGPLVHSGDVTYGADAKGQYVKMDTYAGADYIAMPAFHNIGTWSGASVVCISQYGDDASGTYPGLVASVSSGNYYGNFLLSDSQASGNRLIQWRCGNSSTSLNISGVIDYSQCSIVATWDKSNLRAYQSVNGGEISSHGPTAQTTDFVGASAPENFLGYYSRSGGRSKIEPIYMAAVYDRALSQEEASQIIRSPYAFLIPA